MGKRKAGILKILVWYMGEETEPASEGMVPNSRQSFVYRGLPRHDEWWWPKPGTACYVTSNRFSGPIHTIQWSEINQEAQFQTIQKHTHQSAA